MKRIPYDPNRTDFPNGNIYLPKQRSPYLLGQDPSVDDVSQLNFWGRMKMKAMMPLIKEQIKANRAEALRGLLDPVTDEFRPDMFPGEDPTQLSGQNTSGLEQITAPGLLEDNPQGRRFVNALLDAGDVDSAYGLLKDQVFPESPDINADIAHYKQARLLNMIPQNLGYQDFLAMKRGGVTVNVGQGKPLGADAANWRNEQGGAPNPTLDVYQAAEQGFRPQTNEQLKATQSAQEAAPMFGNLIKYGFGDKGEQALFPGDDSSMLDRGWGYINSRVKGITDSDKRISLYESGRKSVVTGLARMVGQVGNLTNEDVALVADLLPSPGLTPDSVAKEKFRQIAQLLGNKGVSQGMLQNMGFPDWAFGSDQSNQNLNIQDKKMINGSEYIKINGEWYKR